MNRQWVCIDVGCGAEAADELAGAIADAFGVGVEVLAEGVRLYLQEDFFRDTGRQALEDLLKAFQPFPHKPAAPLSYALSLLAEEDWLEQWKRDFKPLRVGKRLVVAPTWEAVAPRDGDRIIRIDPGQAFGTGHHETTRLCLEWLESWTESRPESSSQSLLDVGTGTGILAIAGALLGFDRILALDHDPEAIPVAGENLALNGVNDRIALQLGTVEAVSGHFEVVLANIQALPLVAMSSHLQRRLADAGRLVLSGILIDQAALVQSAYEQEGLELRGREAAGEWCLLEFARSQRERQE